jgi:hypothetical protein
MPFRWVSSCAFLLVSDFAPLGLLLDLENWQQLLEFVAIQILGRLPFKRGKQGVLVLVTYLPPSRQVWHGPLLLLVLEELSQRYRPILLLAP